MAVQEPQERQGKWHARMPTLIMRDLEKGFVKAFNRLVMDRDKHMERWQQMKSDGTPLEKIRAGQMMEAVENEPLTRFVPEIAQLVLCEVTVLGAKKYEFFFLEGSRGKGFRVDHPETPLS